ncbi:MAG: dolichyl-phosphate beta-glucosyltransferase [Deltaproteobacteria bacterium]
MSVPVRDRRLSIVVPAYNEERRIRPTLERLVAYGRSQLAGFEVVVVDDGSGDGTCRVVGEAAKEAAEIRLIPLPKNRGKGAAVRRGMLEAREPFTLFTDADLSTPIEDVERLFDAIETTPVAIGSRALADSKIEIHQPFYREWMGRGFNLLVRAAAVPAIHDSQCGFKLFRTPVAKELFGRAQLDGFAFDVELLFLCQKLGVAVAEVPVHWRNDTASRVRPVRDALRMARDIAIIRAIHR